MFVFGAAHGDYDGAVDDDGSDGVMTLMVIWREGATSSMQAASEKKCLRQWNLADHLLRVLPL